jgi:MYXO-CTERM domain-containing protein
VPTRTISRLISTTAAVSAIGLAASGSALATPAPEDCACGGARVAQTTATAPPKPHIAPPPTWPENPQPLPPPQTVSATTDAGFQWDDAGIGAGGALAVVVLAGLGGAFVLRRRHETDPPLAA